MKNDILEGFSLALLTQLNAYSIITKGKRMFSEKKKTNTTQTQKYSTEPKQTMHISANYFWWNWLFCSNKLQGSCRLCPQKQDPAQKLDFILRVSDRKNNCLL